LFTIVLNYTVL